MKVVEKQVRMTLCEEPLPIQYDDFPGFTKEDYQERIERLWKMEQAQNYDFIIIYGDREHFSNVDYFTGYDVRWEETLLILQREKVPTLLVGNEGRGYVNEMVTDLNIELYQTFSLMGTPNDERSKKLKDILVDSGLKEGSRIGLIGWKEYRRKLFSENQLLTDVPYYIVTAIAEITGLEQIQNAVGLLCNCEYGLKHTLTAKEIIHFELSGTKTSRGVYNCIKHARPGMREIEVAAFLNLDGEPQNLHPTVNFGKRHVAAGIGSATYDQKLEYGMPMGIGYGLRGSLIHKSGMYIRNMSDLSEEEHGYLDKFLKPYFAATAKWYEMSKIGVTCGELYRMVDETLGIKKFGIGLVPGHFTHTDEWTNSPFTSTSDIRLHSGMALQCDFAVGFTDPFMSAHIDDGYAIADSGLQNEIRQLSPTAYERFQKRKSFMKAVLNIQLPDEVLPLSDIPGVCFPFMADTSVILAIDA